MTNNKCLHIPKLGMVLGIRNLKLGIETFFHRKRIRAFTLVEVMVVVGVVLIFLTLLTPNLVGTQQTASLDQAVLTLVSDIRLQQAKAVAGDTEGRGITDSYGIFFDTTDHQYILFHGSSYNPSSSDNYAIDLPAQVEFSGVSLPSTQVVFLSLSGETSGYVADQNAITLENSQTGEQKTIEINRFGVITQVN